MTPYHRICILGSTGSVGAQAVDVCVEMGRRVVALACASQVERLAEQIVRVRPEAVALAETAKLDRLMAKLREVGYPESYWPLFLTGPAAATRLAEKVEADLAIGAMVGLAGLEPLVAFAGRGDGDIALANKESLVAGGDVLMPLVVAKGIRLLTLDSEHAAIAQCLRGEEKRTLRRIWLTASGGPFRGLTAEQMDALGPEEAVAHPTWSMGPKISVDCATLMNKGLELIEAMHLFGVPEDQIKIVIHPQSVIHSMVEFLDGAVMAQLGWADMKLPIRLALAYPGRDTHPQRPFIPTDPVLRNLSFEEPDTERFPALRLAREAAQSPKSLAIVMNAANEVAVAAFLRGELRFTEIVAVVADAMTAHKRSGLRAATSLETVRVLDREGRRLAEETIRRLEKREPAARAGDGPARRTAVADRGEQTIWA